MPTEWEIAKFTHGTHNLPLKLSGVPLTKQQAQHVHCQIVEFILHAGSPFGI